MGPGIVQPLDWVHWNRLRSSNLTVFNESAAVALRSTLEISWSVRLTQKGLEWSRGPWDHILA